MKGTNFQIEKAHGFSTIMNEKRLIASSIIMKFQNTRNKKKIKSFQSGGERGIKNKKLPE